MDYVHIAAGGDENGLQGGFADPVHGIQHHLQTPGADGVHIYGPDDGVHILVHGVDELDEPGADALLKGDGDIVRLLLQGVDIPLQVGCHHLVRVPAALGEDLDAVVDGGVVTGGDGHAVGEVVVLHGEHDEGRGGLPVHHHAADALARHDLGGPVGGLLGEEAAVVPDEEAPLGHPLVLHLAAEGRRQELHVGPGELIADDGPPAAGTEFDAHKIASLRIDGGYGLPRRSAPCKDAVTQAGPVYPITTVTVFSLPRGMMGIRPLPQGRPFTETEAIPFSTPQGF